MPTLESIQMKIKRLQDQAEAIAATRASATLGRIVELMEKGGVTVSDIEAYMASKKRGTKRGKTASAQSAAGTAKYQDPKTGATWSGRGRAPAWIAQAKNRARYLVDANAASSPAPAENGAKDGAKNGAKGGVKRRGNYVRGQQPAKYLNPKTGATWSGRGRAPAWLATAKSRAKFLIDGASEGTQP